MSVVFVNSCTGELHRLDVDSALSVRELKAVLLHEIPSLRGIGASTTPSELQLWTEHGQCLCSEETLGGEAKEEESVEEMRLFVKVHRRLPVVCGGCKRHYEVMTGQSVDNTLQRLGEKEEQGEREVQDKEDGVNVTGHPCLLQCGHSVCLDCMRRWFHDTVTLPAVTAEKSESSSETNGAWKPDLKTEFKCPEVGCGRTSIWSFSIALSNDDNTSTGGDFRETDSLYNKIIVPHTAMEQYLRWKRRLVDMESARSSSCCAVDVVSQNNVDEKTVNKEEMLDCIEELAANDEQDESFGTNGGGTDDFFDDDDFNFSILREVAINVIYTNNVDDDDTNDVEDASRGVVQGEPLLSWQQRKVCMETIDRTWMDLQQETERSILANRNHWDRCTRELDDMFDAMEQRLKVLRELTRRDLRNRHSGMEMSLQELSSFVSTELGRLKVALLECEDILSSPTLVSDEVSELNDLHFAGSKIETDRLEKLKEVVQRMLTPVDASFVFENTVRGLRQCLMTPKRLETVKSSVRSLTIRTVWYPFEKRHMMPLNDWLVYRKDSDESNEFVRGDQMHIGDDTVIRNLDPNTTYIVRYSSNSSVSVSARTENCLTRKEFVEATPLRSGLSLETYRENVAIYEKQFQKRSPAPEDIEILMRLGEHFEIQFDLRKSEEYFSLAADLGHVPAKLRFALVKRNPLDPLRELAEQGCTEAFHFLGTIYYDDTSVHTDYGEAAKWFRRSAELGYSVGQYFLGLCFLLGKGVGQDLQEALKWFEKSASQGNGFAMKRAGRFYENGIVVKRDYARAEELYRSAIRAGSPSCKYDVKKLLRALSNKRERIGGH